MGRVTKGSNGWTRRTRWGWLPLPALLAGCRAVVLAPAGDVAAQQRDLVVQSTVLMLIIIVPVMILTVVFAWRYRQSNRAARYEPDWDHSTHLELVIWAIPLLIIICLGALTWVSTHLLDPYRPLGRIAAGRPVVALPAPPGVSTAARSPVMELPNTLQVEAVALDWKWLFIYPQYGVATVNELAAPVDRPIRFYITASSVMNAFYVPALAGMVYAMPGMRTQLHAVINRAGTYQGFSANYSGAGFSGMHFAFHGLDDAGFDAWVARVRSAGGTLDRPTYQQLARPSENEPVHTFAAVDGQLFGAILGMCVEPGTRCMNMIMNRDMGDMVMTP